MKLSPHPWPGLVRSLRTGARSWVAVVVVVVAWPGATGYRTFTACGPRALWRPRSAREPAVGVNPQVNDTRDVVSWAKIPGENFNAERPIADKC